MAVEKTYTEAPDDDAEGRVLSTLAEGRPYVFVVTTGADVDGLSLRVAVDGQLDEALATRLLAKTLHALGGIPDDLRPLFGMEYR